MIAALAGGSLPFILRTVMQPEKPEIEIGTVSFKNQMDEIIKNFVQYWPIYDLPFDVYTAEDEEKDRLKKEQEEEQSTAAAAAAAAMAQRKERSVPVCPANASIPPPLPAINVFQFESGEDTVDGSRVDVVDNNHIEDRASVDMSPSAAPCHHVCFDVSTKDEEPEVDIVIYLPGKHGDTWLDEWSDFDNNDAESTSSSDESLNNGEVFAMTELA